MTHVGISPKAVSGECNIGLFTEHDLAAGTVVLRVSTNLFFSPQKGVRLMITAN